MAGDWIKMRNDLADDPAVIAIAAAVGLDEYAVVGRLHTLWAWADEQSRDGHAVGVTATWLDRKVRCDGFASALAVARWLDVSAGGLSIPNFENHNGATAKTRALATRRQQRHRALDPLPESVTIASANGHAADVTKASPEKRREEKKKTSLAKASEGRFPDFWNAWPKTERKTDRKRCVAKWLASKLDEQADSILAHVAAMKSTRTWSDGYEPAPLKYLNGERWNDGAVVNGHGPRGADIFAGAI